MDISTLRDKYGLLYHGIQDELTALFEALDSAVDKPFEMDEESDTMARLVTVFEHVLRHDRFYRLMLCADGFSKFSTLLRKSLAERLERRFRQSDRQTAIPIALHTQLHAAAYSVPGRNHSRSARHADRGAAR